MLMENIYPKLKEYCRERGLEFQVVDMRWGVRDESTDDHKTADLCMNEIDNCQRLSLGPNFVVRSLKNILWDILLSEQFIRPKNTFYFGHYYKCVFFKGFSMPKVWISAPTD